MSDDDAYIEMSGQRSTHGQGMAEDRVDWPEHAFLPGERSVMDSGPINIGTVDIRKSLELYRNQAPRQATLMIPAWLKRRLDELPEEEHQALLQMMDGIASQFGLVTPVEIIEMKEQP